MKTYIIRRLLLMPLTLLGVTFLVFCITRFVPGGPIEQMMQQQSMSALSGQKAGSQRGDNNLSEADMERLEEQYSLQEPIITAYLQWLGVLPKKIFISREEFGEIGGAGEGDKEDEYSGISDTHTRINLNETGEQVVVVRQDKDSGSVKDAFFSGTPSRKAASEGWTVDIESPMDRAERWARRMRQTDNTEAVRDKARGYAWRAVMYKTSFDGLLQGTMGNSFKYNEPVWDMIKERIPVSLYFGILSAIITYSVCIPLGVVKAIRHKSLVDNISSVLIFLGYSVPGFALGAVLVVYLGARLEWFPLCGLTSPDFADMGFWQQAGDLLHHTVLPLICYVVSSFAITTMMMKNNLMDNLRGLHQDSHGQGREFQRGRHQACLPQLLYTHCLHSGQPHQPDCGRLHAGGKGFRYPGVRDAELPGSDGQGLRPDHGNAAAYLLPDGAGQPSLRYHRGRCGSAHQI